MNSEETLRYGAQLDRAEQRIAEENRAATLTMWTGIGAILSLMLTCLLGCVWKIGARMELSIAVLAVLLIASVILFFVPAKQDERWYLVCSLLNHAGIGLAVLVLMEYLGLEPRLGNLALSCLPAAAILFGVVMFFVSANGDKRGGWLYGGLAALILICCGALLKFYYDWTEFWLCMAVCALLSCVNLAALLWSVRDPESRSIFQGLAVASFFVYLLLLAAAAVVLLVGAVGAGGSSNNRNRNKNGKGSSQTGGNSGSANRGGTGIRSLFGGLFATNRTRTVTRRRTFFYPAYLWYYTPRTRYASIDRMEGVSEAEREAARRRYNTRRIIALVCVGLFVAAVIVLAVLAGRG